MAKRRPIPVTVVPSTNGHHQRTKPGVRRVYADDCTVFIGGETYYPHVGEWVDFRPGASTGTFALLTELQSSIGSMAEMNASDRARLAQLLDECASEISLRVRAWNWTDLDDSLLPSPPTKEAIKALDFNEMSWLLTNSLGSRSEAERKNELSPSG